MSFRFRRQKSIIGHDKAIYTLLECRIECGLKILGLSHIQ